MTAPTSSRFAARKIARPVSYDSTRTFMAGVVKGGTSPRPRARYNSWIDAGRTPACCPISQISQRARSLVSVVPKTASRTSASSAGLWRTLGSRNFVSVVWISAGMRKPPRRGNLRFGYLDHQPIVRRCDTGRQAGRERGVGGVVRQVREERAPRADAQRGRDGFGNGEVQRM